mmetsp:Transcript_16543/g.53986  ORF Transcript_16543/g.53986 Transcript_16543/m.53986 type:complete len:469 (-) Transcript_16543:891-2297(-)
MRFQAAKLRVWKCLAFAEELLRIGGGAKRLHLAESGRVTHHLLLVCTRLEELLNLPLLRLRLSRRRSFRARLGPAAPRLGALHERLRKALGELLSAATGRGCGHEPRVDCERLAHAVLEQLLNDDWLVGGEPLDASAREDEAAEVFAGRSDEAVRLVEVHQRDALHELGFAENVALFARGEHRGVGAGGVNIDRAAEDDDHRRDERASHLDVRSVFHLEVLDVVAEDAHVVLGEAVENAGGGVALGFAENIHEIGRKAFVIHQAIDVERPRRLRLELADGERGDEPEELERQRRVLLVELCNILEKETAHHRSVAHARDVGAPHASPKEGHFAEELARAHLQHKLAAVRPHLSRARREQHQKRRVLPLAHDALTLPHAQHHHHPRQRPQIPIRKLAPLLAKASARVQNLVRLLRHALRRHRVGSLLALLAGDELLGRELRRVPHGRPLRQLQVLPEQSPPQRREELEP